jgi:hypothetical protein
MIVLTVPPEIDGGSDDVFRNIDTNPNDLRSTIR